MTTASQLTSGITRRGMLKGGFGLASNPGNKAGLTTAAQKMRDAKMFFNQGTQIWTQTIPTMIQNVLTKAMTPAQAAANAESQIHQIMG